MVQGVVRCVDKESVNIPLDFYPLCEAPCHCLRHALTAPLLLSRSYGQGDYHRCRARDIDKDLLAVRHVQDCHKCKILLDLGWTRHTDLDVQTHLFLHHVLRYHLGRAQVKEAVIFASHYDGLVYFSHALEILLHTVVEAEADMETPLAEPSNSSAESLASAGTLPHVIEFLDHFDASLDVVVGCARKTEMARWKRLFDIVGSPQALFEVSSCVPVDALAYK